MWHLFSSYLYLYLVSHQPGQYCCNIYTTALCDSGSIPIREVSSFQRVLYITPHSSGPMREVSSFQRVLYITPHSSGPMREVSSFQRVLYITPHSSGPMREVSSFQRVLYITPNGRGVLISMELGLESESVVSVAVVECPSLCLSRVGGRCLSPRLPPLAPLQSPHSPPHHCPTAHLLLVPDQRLRPHAADCLPAAGGDPAALHQRRRCRDSRGGVCERVYSTAHM